MQKIHENSAKMLQIAEKLQVGEGEVKSPRLNHPTTGVEYHAQNRDGKRIICKHMVAVYLTVYPEEAERIYNEAIAYEEEEERRSEELMRKVVAHIKKMKKEELQQTLTAFLLDGPEWQYDRFVRMFDLEEY